MAREFECGSCGVVFTVEGDPPQHAPTCEYADTVDAAEAS